MSHEERFGTRDRSYSAWHRRDSLGRFLGRRKAETISMIDLDSVEYDKYTMEPVALLETAIDVDQPIKPFTVTVNLAKRASLPAYVLLYRLCAAKNPADTRCRDIDRFRVRRVHPDPETDWKILSPRQWARALAAMRVGNEDLDVFIGNEAFLECHFEELCNGNV